MYKADAHGDYVSDWAMLPLPSQTVLDSDVSQLRTRVHRLSDASTVRDLLNRVHQRIDLGLLHITLLHDWEGWLLRIQARYSLTYEVLEGLEAIVQEHGEIAVLTTRFNLVFLQLDCGMEPLEVMQRYSVPVIFCGEVDLEELRVFCEELTQGLGFQPQSLG